MHPVNTYVSHTVHFVPTHFQCFPCLYSSIFNYKLHCAVRAYLQYAGGKCHLVGTIKRNEGGLEVLVVARYNPRPTKWVMDNRWRCWEPGWGYKMMLIWCCLFVSSVRSSNSHPDLLLIQPPPTHFFRSHRSSKLDFHFLSHYSYIKAIMLYKGKTWQDFGILWNTLAHSGIL